MKASACFNFDTDRGGVLWGCLCCWLGVLANVALLQFSPPVLLIVLWTLFGVPIVVTIVIACISHLVREQGDA